MQIRCIFSFVYHIIIWIFENVRVPIRGDLHTFDSRKLLTAPDSNSTYASFDMLIRFWLEQMYKFDQSLLINRIKIAFS